MGTYLTPTLVPALLEMICASTGVAPLLGNLPEGIEVTMRQSDADPLMFVANTTAAPVSVPDLPAGKDILTGLPHEKGRWILNPYACCVIRLDTTS